MADLAPPSPPLVTRLAQGPLTAGTGEPADPLDSDRMAAPDGDAATRVTGLKALRPVEAAVSDVVTALP